jgi:hypothetical protein
MEVTDDSGIMTAEVLQAKVFDLLRRFSAVPALTYKEEAMLDLLYNEFIPHSGQELREVRVERLPYYNLLLGTPQQCPFLFIAHIDRVPDFHTGEPHVNVMQDGSEYGPEYLTGQLDNIISIALLKLVQQQYPINVLFTTREEHCESAPQIIEVMDLFAESHGLVPVSVDIDIFRELSEFNQDHPVTLRTRCQAGVYDLTLVAEFRDVATKYDIPWSGNERGHTIVEAGFLESASRGKYKGAHIGIPLINYHSHRETTTWKTVYNTYRFLCRLVERHTLAQPFSYLNTTEE